VNYRKQIADFGAENRLPTMSGLREFVDAGGLLSYGPDLLAIADALIE
jgi:putative tryptophan/tyrosine transport system substrate-binding protein